METKYYQVVLKYAFEFTLINFLILGLFELFKPNLVSGLIRLDWYFGILIILGFTEFISHSFHSHDS